MQGNYFQIHHNAVDERQSFGELLFWCAYYLHFNSDECVILCIKNNESEPDPDGVKKFFEVFEQYKTGFGNYRPSFPVEPKWYFDDEIPTLEDAKGKLVLVRRFDLPPEATSLGINAANGIDGGRWTDSNAGFTIRISDSELLRGQDDYDWAVGKIDEKWGVVKRFLTEARDPPTEGEKKLFINFCSASGGAYPYYFAKGLPGTDGVNELLFEYLGGVAAPARLGIVILDFPEYPHGGLVYDLIQKNPF